VNNEGRAQRFYRVFLPGGEVQESWRWLRDIMRRTGRSQGGAWQIVDDIVDAMADSIPAFGTIQAVAPPAGFRMAGQKIPRQSYRWTARTSMHADVDVSEPKPPDDPDSPLAFSMEGFEGQPPAALIPRFWAPHWNSIQSLNKFQEEIAGPLRGGDAGLRLIEPDQGEKTGYFERIPPAFEKETGTWLIVPAYHIFGSEELSVLTPGVMELAPEPYLGLNPEDAAGLPVAEGEEIEFTVEERVYLLPVRFITDLPQGVATLPAGLPEGPEMAPPGKRAEIGSR
jgi:NADH-quinone oxidoreductase subunit G